MLAPTLPQRPKSVGGVAAVARMSSSQLPEAVASAVPATLATTAPVQLERVNTGLAGDPTSLSGVVGGKVGARGRAREGGVRRLTPQSPAAAPCDGRSGQELAEAQPAF